MKIWIDITNSPHINFFKPFIKKWNDEGNEIIITTRDLANTIDLIKQNNWNYYEIGGHAGKNKVKKLLYFPRRVLLLRKFLKTLNLILVFLKVPFIPLLLVNYWAYLLFI